MAVASAGPYAILHLSRQITTPAPHHSVFYRPDALPAAQPTASSTEEKNSTIYTAIKTNVFNYLNTCVFELVPER